MYNKTAELFIKKNGLSGIERLRSLANQGADLTIIANTFNVSRSTAGRLQQTLLKRVYYISDATADWLKYCEQRHLWIAEQHTKEISQSAPAPNNLLVFPGGKRA